MQRNLVEEFKSAFKKGNNGLVQLILINGIIFFVLRVLEVVLALTGVIVGCAHSRIRRYEKLLEPEIGLGTKADMRALFGAPVNCNKSKGLERCEYRTARERNDPVPAVMMKTQGLGPDVSAYEYFDVLHLFYDDFGVLREWAPIVIRTR